MKIFFYLSTIVILSFATEDAVFFIKEKEEIKALKVELNIFYSKKEKEYQKRKIELEDVLQKVEIVRKDTKNIYAKNTKILKEIKGEIEGKTTKIYNAMKAKNTAKIFNKMIEEGKTEDVFDIILRLKESNVTSIFKFLNVRYTSELTAMFENYENNNELKEK